MSIRIKFGISAFRLLCLLIGFLGLPPFHAASAKDNCPALDSKKVSVLIVTGGHPYEPDEFFAAFRSMKGVTFQHVMLYRGKPIAVPAGGLGKYDVVLFYDMTIDPTEITPEWRSLLDRGKGLIFLHHALGSFPGSSEIRNIIGGQANFGREVYADVPQATFQHNLKQHFTITDTRHPITCGLSDFDMIDEAYDNFIVNPDAHVLMTSDFPTKSPAAAWTREYGKKRVFYLQPGHGAFALPLDHGPTAYQNDKFLRILHRGILWAGRR